MIPVKQTRIDDCLSACIASLLDLPLEDVPYETGDDWLEKFRDFLEPKGLSLEQIAYTVGKWPRGFSILSVWLNKEKSHAVVALNGQVVHDPNTEDLAFVQNAPVRKWLVVTILDPKAAIERLRQ